MYKNTVLVIQLTGKSGPNGWMPLVPYLQMSALTWTGWGDNPTQRTHDAIITSLWRQNDVTRSFWRHKDVIIALGVRWETPRWHLRSPATWLFAQQLIQAGIKENTKASQYRPLERGIHRSRWIPLTKGQWYGKRFHGVASSWRLMLATYICWKEMLTPWPDHKN